MPKISVLIPTYNYGTYLNVAIESVLQQTYSDFELIVLDNCSTDNTAEVVSRYLDDPRLKYFKNETNIGNINNFNKILQLSSGDYIKFLFSDDYLHHNALSEFVHVLDDHKDVSLVTSYFEYFGSINKTFTQPRVNKVLGYEAIKDTLLLGNWIGAPSNVIFRKSFYDQKGFKNEWRWWADLEFWHRLLQHGNLFIIPKVLSKFRYHSSSATQDCKINFEDVFDEYYYLRHIRKNNLYAPLKDDNEFKAHLKKNAENWISLIPDFKRANRIDLIAKALYAIIEEGLFFKKCIGLFQKMRNVFKHAT